MIEHGGGGGAVAGPVTRAVYNILFPPEPELAKNARKK